MDLLFVILKTVAVMSLVAGGIVLVFKRLTKDEEVTTEVAEETSEEDVGEEVVIPEFVLPEFIFKLDEYHIEEEKLAKLVRTHYFVEEEGVESWKGTRSSKLMVTKYAVGEVVYSADTLSFGNYREEESLRASENEVFVVQCLTFKRYMRGPKEFCHRENIIAADSAVDLMKMIDDIKEDMYRCSIYMHTWIKVQKVRMVKLAEVESYEVKFGAKRVIGTSDTM